jgi:hypothetical protein
MQGSVDPSTSDAVSCHELLALAEERLREGADQAGDERWSWIPHAFNLGLNAAAAVVVAEMYDRDSAYWSGALGFAVGEVRIWSFPWHAARDWEAYQTRFRETARDPETTWRLEPTEDGARFVLRF